MWSHPIFLDMTGDGKKGQINKMASPCLLVRGGSSRKWRQGRFWGFLAFLIFFGVDWFIIHLHVHNDDLSIFEPCFQGIRGSIPQPRQQTSINMRHVHYKLSCSKVEDVHVGACLDWMLQMQPISNMFNTDYPNIQYVDITRLHNEYSIRSIIPRVSGKQIGSAAQDTSGSRFCQEKGQDGPRGCILWPIEEPGYPRISFRDWPIALLTSRLVGASVLCGCIMAARDSHVNSTHCTS